MAGYKEKMHDQLVQKALAADLCDERGVAFVAVCRSIGGMVLVTVNDDTLCISDVDMQNNPLKVLKRIPLSEISDVTVKASWLTALMGGETFSFRYKGKKLGFSQLVVTGFVREAIDVILSEANN